jgi:hypothetical protein
MSHSCNSKERSLIQGKDNYDSDSYEHGVRGRDEAESTELNWIIPGDSSVSCYVNTVVSTLELNPPKND